WAAAVHSSAWEGRQPLPSRPKRKQSPDPYKPYDRTCSDDFQRRQRDHTPGGGFLFAHARAPLHSSRTSFFFNMLGQFDTSSLTPLPLPELTSSPLNFSNPQYALDLQDGLKLSKGMVRYLVCEGV